MGFFGNLMKKDTVDKTPKGFHHLTVKKINRLTPDSVEVVFSIPDDLKNEYSFVPGQYVTLDITIDGKEERRSYSICSKKGEDLAIAVKEVEGGKVSPLINKELSEGQTLLVSKPEGRFMMKEVKNIVGIAAGSGITPIISMAYEIEDSEGCSMKLLFANKTENDIIFRDRLDRFQKTQKRYFLTQEKKEGFDYGRITKDAFVNFIKEDLDVLKSDGFYICGPEEMINNVKEALVLFGVPESKIHFELYVVSTESDKKATKEVVGYQGIAQVKAIIDDDVYEFEMDGSKMSVLDAALDADADAPYSCKGGVCCTCRAKVLEGNAIMKLNYTLTEEEVNQGYVLTCQAIPTTPTLTVSYDD
ncbi:MAG TPA: 2Fe-2S iron-sulfur cluster-binding protein [Taishania sp.]|nr:2Fe-2S iron-sulfur cluster-binding protein [Taishania sp.]